MRIRVHERLCASSAGIRCMPRLPVRILLGNGISIWVEFHHVHALIFQDILGSLLRNLRGIGVGKRSGQQQGHYASAHRMDCAQVRFTFALFPGPFSSS